MTIHTIMHMAHTSAYIHTEVSFLKCSPAKGHKASANLTNVFNIVFMNLEGKL